MDTHSQGMDAWQFKSFSSCLLRQVKDKFCLDMNEEEAVQHFQSLIDESVRAVMAVFVEQIHKWAQVRGGGGGEGRGMGLITRIEGAYTVILAAT